jgi:hypothetical protein
MAIPSLLGSYIDQTYQRLVQTTGSGTEFADGLGNPITFGTTNTGSLLLTASVANNTITFTKGNGTTFPITVNTGSGGGGSTFPYTGSAIISGSLIVTGSTISTLGFTGSLQGTASWATNAITSSRPINTLGTTLYSTNPTAGSGFNTTGSIILGTNAGASAINANNSIFIGNEAGNNAINSQYSNFLGLGAGYLANNSPYSNFIGYYAGAQTSTTQYSNFFGKDTGRQATNAYNSNFLGWVAGFGAINAFNSNFLGQYAGTYAASASYSTLIGYQVGFNTSGNTVLGIKSNNIIIGTNITLPDGTKDSINLGGIIFATGSYSNPADNPYSGSQYGIGKVGINKVSPSYTLDVSGSINFSDVIYQNGVPYGGGALSGGTTGYIPVFTSATSVTSSYLNQSGNILKTTSASVDIGLNLDFGSGFFTINNGSNQIFVGPNNAVMSAGIIEITGGTNSGFNANGPTTIIGDYNGNTNGTTLTVNDAAEKVTINKHLEVDMGSIVPYYTVTGIDLNAATYDITGSGIFEITTVDFFSPLPITFPDPTTHNGQTIFVVNASGNAVTIDNTNTYAPYAAGTNTQLSIIGIEDMLHFISIGGKWRGIKSGK